MEIKPPPVKQVIWTPPKKKQQDLSSFQIYQLMYRKHRTREKYQMTPRAARGSI